MNNNNFKKIIHQISYYPKKRLDIFNCLDLQQKSDIIKRLSKRVQYEIITSISKEDVVNILECLDPDEATDILQLLPEKKRKPIVAELNEQLRSDISLLLKFDPETAAGLMNVNYIQVEHDDTISSVAGQLKTHEERTGKTPLILVMEHGKLIGYLPAYELGYGHSREKALKYAKKTKTIIYTAKTDEIMALFRKLPHNKIIVLGNKKNVIGVIYSDDVLKLLHEKEASSLYDFAGVNDEESIYDSVKRKVNFRYKWLIINLGTAFLAALTVGLFDETISKYVILAVYMPIVAGMGGNAATQTLAVLVRGISQRQIDLSTMWRTLKSELGSGFINGLINGLIITAVVAIKDDNIKIGLILGLAMMINMLIAALFGTIVPLVMKRLGKDPASSATIFISTATDVFGFLVFLSLASVILN
jgi:magnesium transporter